MTSYLTEKEINNAIADYVRKHKITDQGFSVHLGFCGGTFSQRKIYAVVETKEK